MKRLILLLLVMCSFTFSYSQVSERYVGYMKGLDKQTSEKDLDDAYLAIPKKLINKKWYSTIDDYIFFNSNGTGASVTDKIIMKDSPNPIHLAEKMPFRWKRNGLVITITYIESQTTVTVSDNNFAKLSARKKDEAKRICAKRQQEYRQTKFRPDKCETLKLTDDIFIYERKEYSYDGQLYGTTPYYYVTKKKLDELIAIQKNE